MTTRISRDWADVQKTLSQYFPIRSKVPRATGDTVPHVAIIGAGFAGLRCADVLIRHEVKVTIFEARDRIGGRAHQAESGGHLIDLGPNWIHSIKDNPIFKIARDLEKVVLKIVEDPGTVFDGNGTQLKQDVAQWLSETMWSVVVDAFKYSDQNSNIVGAGQSLMKFYEIRIAALSPPDFFTADWTELQSLLLGMARTWGAYVGDPIESQSLKFFFLEECVDGETIFVASTHRDIIKEVAKVALEGAEIKFNEKVVSIQPDEDTHRPSAIITTAKGTSVMFDQVVVTCRKGP